MSVSDTLNCEAAIATFGERLEFINAETLQKLNDLIYKEEVNQLWKLQMECTMQCIWEKVRSQYAGDSVSSQTDGLFTEGCDTSQKSSRHLHGPSEENCLSFTDDEEEEKSCLLFNDEEDRQSNSRAIPASSSSANENESSASVVPDMPQHAPSKRPHTLGSEQMGSFSSTHSDTKSSRNDGLSKHKRSHSESIQSSSQCQRCLRVFRDRGNLRQHDVACQKRARKLPFECVTCGRSYDTREQLKSHSYRHNKKKHLCPVCGKAFLKPAQVNEHMVTHTGERPFSCRFCTKQYTFRKGLNRHLHTCHSK